MSVEPITFNLTDEQKRSLVKIATMLETSVGEILKDAVDFYIYFNRKHMIRYDTFFGTKEHELDERNEFYEYIEKYRKEESTRGAFARFMLDADARPEKIWDIRQVLEFIELHGKTKEYGRVGKELWNRHNCMKWLGGDSDELLNRWQRVLSTKGRTGH